ncbi:MAG: hypothetical protein KDB21_12440 [Acidimicrobiales bacterium]|nr:hypothetical protein [Acidimicrobiales bacterium]
MANDPSGQRRRPAQGERPAHPTRAATLLMVGIVVVIVLLAWLGAR